MSDEESSRHQDDHNLDGDDASFGDDGSYEHGGEDGDDGVSGEYREYEDGQPEYDQEEDGDINDSQSYADGADDAGDDDGVDMTEEEFQSLQAQFLRQQLAKDEQYQAEHGDVYGDEHESEEGEQVDDDEADHDDSRAQYEDGEDESTQSALEEEFHARQRHQQQEQQMQQQQQQQDEQDTRQQFNESQQQYDDGNDTQEQVDEPDESQSSPSIAPSSNPPSQPPSSLTSSSSVFPIVAPRPSSGLNSAPSSVSSRPPLPVSELDVHMNHYLGLKVITSGKVDLSLEGEEGKHWVKAEDLPKYSQRNCEQYYPYQPKRILFETNKQNIITWVRYA